MLKSSTPVIQRLFYGIITGACIFGAYFGMDMLLSYLYGSNPYRENELIFLLGTFLFGAIVAQVYFWYYKKGLKRRGANV